MKREIMAACAVILLGACERSNDQTTSRPQDATVSTTSEFGAPTPGLRPVDAATQEKIDLLKKRRDERLSADPLPTPTASPATEE